MSRLSAAPRRLRLLNIVLSVQVHQTLQQGQTSTKLHTAHTLVSRAMPVKFGMFKTDFAGLVQG